MKMFCFEAVTYDNRWGFWIEARNIAEAWDNISFGIGEVTYTGIWREIEYSSGGCDEEEIYTRLEQ